MARIAVAAVSVIRACIDMKIARYFRPECVFFLDVCEREAAILQMVQLLSEAGAIGDREEFTRAVFERERVVSTAVGLGIAIPHAKLTGYDDFFIAVGIAPRGVEWQSLDGMPVRLIFMVGGPDDKQTEYLQLLSSLTVAVRDEERRKALLAEKSAEKIVELFKAY